MARVPYLEKADLKPDDQDLLKRPIALFKALVNSPGGARAFSGLGQYIRFGSKLDPRLRELAILQVGYLDPRALRVVAPRQDRLRLRRDRRRHRGADRRDRR